MPKHRAPHPTDPKPAAADVWLSSSSADEARVMRQDDAATQYLYAQYCNDTVRVIEMGAVASVIVLRGGTRMMVATPGISNPYRGTPLPVFA